MVTAVSKVVARLKSMARDYGLASAILWLFLSTLYSFAAAAVAVSVANWIFQDSFKAPHSFAKLAVPLDHPCHASTCGGSEPSWKLRIEHGEVRIEFAPERDEWVGAGEGASW